MSFTVAFSILVVGWLLKQPQAHADIIFNTFKSAWSDTYQYVVRELQPKMEVCDHHDNKQPAG